jgi:tetratricopeptide (TPR) repeat protein
LVKHQATDQAQKLLTPALRQAEINNDRVAQAKLLYLQGRVFSQKADFDSASFTLQKSIKIAKTLNDLNLLLGPVITLAGIYHVTDQNAAAAEQARQCLALSQVTKQPLYEAMSLQLLAISELFAYDAPQAEELIRQSIIIAEKNQGDDYIVQGFSHLGIIKTEHGQYQEAKALFEKALVAANKVENTLKKSILRFTVQGYYARSQSLAGNFKQAATFYQQAILAAEQLGIQQRLVLSQLNQGLSDCLQSQGNSKEAEISRLKAALYEEQAHNNCELNNTFMSFAPKRKSAKRCK